MSFALYNLEQDVAETHDAIGAEPGLARHLRAALDRWTAQCAKSLQGADYQ
jgi:hypothetical protein